MTIMDHRPRTLAGFVAKARWIAALSSSEEWSVQIVRDLCSLGEIEVPS